jgi:hypothetical protein
MSPASEVKNSEQVKHTPGPWTAEEVGTCGHNNEHKVFEVYAHGCVKICTCLENEAALIAAAPMQHELLPCFLIFRPDERKAAISKWAEKYGVQLPVNTDGAWEFSKFEEAAIEAAIAKATGQTQKPSY